MKVIVINIPLPSNITSFSFLKDISINYVLRLKEIVKIKKFGL